MFAEPLFICDRDAGCVFTYDRYIDPYEFGANGSDRIDDTAAIQMAIDGGDNVKLGDGRFIVTTPLNLRNSQTFFGNGRGRTIIENKSKDFAFLLTGNFQGISNLTIDCMDTRKPSTKSNGIDFKGARHSYWEDIQIINCQGIGVRYTDSQETGECRENYSKGQLSVHGGTIGECTGVLFLSGVNNDYTNVNHLSDVAINYCRNGIVVGGAYSSSGNAIDFLTVTGSRDYGINVVKSVMFAVHGGWIEDNRIAIGIADFPAVRSVYITAVGAILTDLKRSHNRGVIVRSEIKAQSQGIFFNAQTNAITSVDFSENVLPDMAKGNVFQISVIQADTPFTIQRPINIDKNDVYYIWIVNNSVGTLGKITWGGRTYTSWDEKNSPNPNESTIIGFIIDIQGNSTQISLDGPLHGAN